MCVMFGASSFLTLTLTRSDNLIVDNGSSNTWVGAGTPYAPTSTSTDTGQAVVSMIEFFDLENGARIFP